MAVVDDHKVDGLILIPPVETDPVLEQLAPAGVPVVLVDRVLSTGHRARDLPVEPGGSVDPYARPAAFTGKGAGGPCTDTPLTVSSPFRLRPFAPTRKWTKDTGPERKWTTRRYPGNLHHPRVGVEERKLAVGDEVSHDEGPLANAPKPLSALQIRQLRPLRDR